MGGCNTKPVAESASAPRARAENRDEAKVEAEVGEVAEKAVAASAVAAVVASAGVVAVSAMQNVGYLEKMSSMMGQFEDVAALIDSPAVSVLTDLFQSSEEILKLVMHAAVPPPGGQILAAAITITGLVIKGAMNVQACKELAIRCNRLVMAAFPHKEALDKMGHESVKAALHQLGVVCDQVQDFIKDVLAQGWFKKLLNVTETAKQIKELEKSMDDVKGCLLTATALAGYTVVLKTNYEVNRMSGILQGMDEAAARAHAIIDANGGYDRMLENDGHIKELIDASGAMDGMMLTMHQKSLNQQQMMMSMMLDFKSNLAAKAADADEDGQHTIIYQESLKTLWRKHFRDKGHVDWHEFWSVFPKHTPNLAPEDIEILEIELRDDDAKAMMRLACDENNDEKISAIELQNSFPENVRLVDQVRALKARPTKKGDHEISLTPPARIFGRDKEINKMFDAICPEGPARVAVIVGKPGEGKGTVAAEVARMLYDKGHALGGTWLCKMADVTSVRDMYSNFIEGLTHVTKPDDKEGGGASTFKLRLTELARKKTNMYVLIDDCECVTNNAKVEKDAKDRQSWRAVFNELVTLMLKEVPKMKLILITCDSNDIEIASKPAVHKLELKPLHPEDGEEMVRTSFPELSEAQAKTIAKNYDMNPLMLNIVISALKDNRMTVEEAMDAASMIEWANTDVQQRVELSIMRSLDSLPANLRPLLLKMALLLPGTFSQDLLTKLLAPTAPKVALDRFKKSSLLEEIKKGEFRVSSMLREAANKMLLDEEKAEANGIGKSVMEACWKRYVSKCYDLVQEDFKTYKSKPENTYKNFKKHKPFVQHALKLTWIDPDMAKLCLRPLLDILGLLPYLGYVHDSTLVQDASQALYSLVDEDEEMGKEQKLYKALCKAVEAHFAPAGNSDEMNHVLELADEAVELLEDCSDAKMHLTLALALRRKGIVLRDMGSYPLSVEALQSAKFNMESGLGTEQAPVELILDLTELAGTLDYQGDIAQGEPIAEDALRRAHQYYGKGTVHPVTALCLTTLGYFLKGKGVECDKEIAAAEAKAAAASSEGKTEEACLAAEEAEKLKSTRQQFHERAVEVNMEALGMRKEVLGQEHMEVALNLQQAGISLVFLGKFQEAEDKLAKSLQMRKMNLPEFHYLIFNTYREQATLYKAWPKPELQIEAMRNQISIGCECFGITHKKVVAVAKDLVAILKAKGLDEEAQQLEAKHSL